MLNADGGDVIARSKKNEGADKVGLLQKKILRFLGDEDNQGTAAIYDEAFSELSASYPKKKSAKAPMKEEQGAECDALSFLTLLQEIHAGFKEMAWQQSASEGGPESDSSVQKSSDIQREAPKLLELLAKLENVGESLCNFSAVTRELKAAKNSRVEQDFSSQLAEFHESRHALNDSLNQLNQYMLTDLSPSQNFYVKLRSMVGAIIGAIAGLISGLALGVGLGGKLGLVTTPVSGPFGPVAAALPAALGGAAVGAAAGGYAGYKMGNLVAKRGVFAQEQNPVKVKFLQLGGEVSTLAGTVRRQIAPTLPERAMDNLSARVTRRFTK